MATLEHIHFAPHNLECKENGVTYSVSSSRPSIKDLPQIFWVGGMPWREANLWAMERATTGEASLKTVASNMNGLLNYAKFLESRGLHWFEFPAKKADRCLVLYRGALIKMRNVGQISPSTASEYMRNCIMFYRWVRHREFIAPHIPLWREKPYVVKFFDQVGFERTINGAATDLSIPNRKRLGQTLEDGLLPLSETDRDAILDFAAENATPELYLMLALGFFTGMRLGSICDLKVQTLEHAVPDPSAEGLLRLAIGPGAAPPVHTKFGVTGQVWIPEALCDKLLEYAKGWRRVERTTKAPLENRDLLFLTRFGNAYGRRGTDQSSAVNVEMSDFRKRGVKAGVQMLRRFRFHQSRCTFGTELARLALSACADVALVIAIVSDALLHAPNSEATTFRYIRFVQALPIKQALSHNFMVAFSGIGLEGRQNG
ncbi:Site-specific recombinase XerD [Serratia fonticola]|uniref:Site-specific recombinase XerD n=1 Tax=Serratia fonticola TaxID=47917 RepID=A0A0F7HEX5_SERFO|nr:site-specific integrase [Serratia fonticola]AKG71802.1 integrase [Serratia fonticola]CAI1595620.1 Site-specific recombinase XerD [Serratia fonticola]VTR53296.1 Site-specific recombinase XerD [Serratia fonticola]